MASSYAGAKALTRAARCADNGDTGRDNLCRTGRVFIADIARPVDASRLFFAALLRRNPGNLFSLGFVLLVVLLSDPLAALGAGFWLSFAAVTAIALATRKKHASFRDENGNRVPTAFKQNSNADLVSGGKFRGPYLSVCFH